jgi:hypothetical protein
MMRQLFIVLLFLLDFGQIRAQSVAGYSRVDAFVKNYSIKIANQSELDEFIDVVMNNFSDDTERLRAAFYWISENIRYNYKAVTESRFQQPTINALLQSGQAICSGYANLMEYFCKKFKIECVTIDGTGRSLYTDIVLDPQKLSIDHSWNAVKVNGQWKLIDATWGSGYTDYATGNYHQWRNDKYFLADPTTFIYKHFPKQASWQLLDTLVTASQFCNYPFVDEGYFTNQLQKVIPFHLYLDRKVGDTLTFQFFTPKELNYVALESLDNKIIERGRLTSTKTGYTYTFRPKKEGEYDLRVSLFYIDEKARSGYVTYSPALIYRLRVNSK